MKKLNKKGFTLTELLATIAILAIVVTIATPAVIGVSNSIKKNMYDAKIKLILQNAKLYGEDNDSTFFSESITTKCIQVKALCSNNYITKDDGANDDQCLENPKDGGFLGGQYVKLEKTNGRIKATYKGDSCS